MESSREIRTAEPPSTHVNFMLCISEWNDWTFKVFSMVGWLWYRDGWLDSGAMAEMFGQPLGFDLELPLSGYFI